VDDRPECASPAGPATGYDPYRVFKFFDPMALTLEALETVETIARRGSFAAAAAELGKVPSALTYTVRKLEDELDVLLFDRRGPRARLTPAGLELRAAGRPLLRASDDLVRRVRRVASGWEPELRVGVDALIDFARLRPLIEDFYRERPPTRLRFSYEVLDGAWESLLEGRADLVIGAPHDAPSPALSATRFGVRPMGRIDWVFCVAPHHPLAEAPEPIAADALAAHRAVAVGGTTHSGPSRAAGLLAGQETLTVATLEHKAAMQAAGLGVGWLPERIARPYQAAGRLVARRTADPRPAAVLHYAWRRADAGRAMGWWLARLDVPRVRERLVEEPPAAPAPAPPQARGARTPARATRGARAGR
jgi:DNA-binding transcriptional LysR family regulator